MWDKSPIAFLEHVKAPTLIALGMKDRRVPPTQGIEYYHALRAKKLPTKLLVYDDCDHAIDLVASEADFWINTKVSIPVLDRDSQLSLTFNIHYFQSDGSINICSRKHR